MTRQPRITLRQGLYAGGAVLAYAAICILILAAKAEAQGFPCVKWPELKADLAKRFHEVPVSSGIVNNRMVLQVTASPDGETWTVMLVGVDGIACIISAGKGWEPGVNPVMGEGRS